MRLPRAYVKYIERELHQYELTKRRIAELQDALVWRSAPALREIVTKGGAIGDPTARQVARRLDTTASIYRMTDTIRAIDLALNCLNDTHRTVFSLYYQRGLDWRTVVRRMPCSESNFYKLKRELIQMVAVTMGLVA